MHLTAITSLAFLSSVAYSSQPLAFTTTTNRIFSKHVRRRVLARSFFHATSTKDEHAEFAAKRRTRTSFPDDDSSLSSSTLSMIVDSQKEFEMNLGKAVDTLKSDYPNLLSKNPTWDIYHKDLEVIDPTGVSLHGLENYKMAFTFVHGVVKWFYCEDKSGLTSIRVGYDWARKCIRCVLFQFFGTYYLPMHSFLTLLPSLLYTNRVSWNVELVPKMVYGGVNNILHVDGISEYNLDRDSGLITEHKVTHLLINDQAVRPANGVWNALSEMSPIDVEGAGVPVFFKADQKQWDEITHVKFQTWNPLTRFGSSTSLFSNPNEQAMQLPDASINTDSPVPYDRDAYNRKNQSRKKFSMPPLTPEEFIAIEEDIRGMDEINKKKAKFLAEQFAQNAQNAKEEANNKENIFGKIFGGVLKNGCESNFDCERPQVCCDVGFKKICCSNGLGIVDGIPVEKYQRGLLRVPMPNDDFDY